MVHIIWSILYCANYINHIIWFIEYVMKMLFMKMLFVSNSKPSKAAAAQVDCLACSTNRKELILSGLFGLHEAN